MTFSQLQAYEQLDTLTRSIPYKNLSSEQKTQELFNIANQVDVNSDGAVTILYSGVVNKPADGSQGISANTIIEQMVTDQQDVRVINKTDAAKFLSSEDFNAALADTADLSLNEWNDRKPLIDPIKQTAKTELQNKLYHATKGPWAVSSEQFLQVTTGEVRVLAPYAPENRTFALVELPTALNNSNITSIEGILRTTLTQTLATQGMGQVFTDVRSNIMAGLGQREVTPSNYQEWLNLRKSTVSNPSINLMKNIVAPTKQEATTELRMLNILSSEADSQSTLHFTFTTPKLGKNTFEVTRFELEESMSAPLRAIIHLASESTTFEMKDIMDEPGTLSIFENKKCTRTFEGIIERFCGKDIGRNGRLYELVLISPLARLNLKTDNRLYQHKSAMEITEMLLKESGITDYETKITNPCETMEYCAQTNETNLDFIHRNLARAGIFYYTYTNHDHKKEAFVFCDNSFLGSFIDRPFEYNANSGGMALMPSIRSFSTQMQLAQTEATFKDYDHDRPDSALLKIITARGDLDHQNTYENYTYPGHYKDDKSGKVAENFTRTKVDALRRDSNIAIAISNLSYVKSGHTFKLTEHPIKNLNVGWLIVSVKHIGTQPLMEIQTENGAAAHYENTFQAMPEILQWKPVAPDIKPIYGAQIAVVVGPQGEEIYTNELGMVKIQHTWDRQHKFDENSSRWVRVLHTSANANYGNINIPRIGAEVILIYINGDPNEPLIIGSTFNQLKRPPFSLPANKTKMGMKTNSHRSEGYSEISMDDATSNELLHIRAQRNMSTHVIKNRTTDVLENHTETIGKNQEITVKENQKMTVIQNRAVIVQGESHEEVHCEKNLEVTKNYTIAALADMQTTVTLNQKEEVGANKTVEVVKDIKISSGTVIELVCGASKLVMNSDGRVTISGKEFLFEATGQIDIKGNYVDLN